MEISERDESRFWSKVALPNREGCMLWLAGAFASGYGEFNIGGKMLRAHRVAHELRIGPIPAGLVVDHLCSVKRCVAPEHLEAVTQRENVLRGKLGRWTHCLRGHPFEGKNVYIFPSTGRRRCQECHRIQEARRRERTQAY